MNVRNTIVHLVVASCRPAGERAVSNGDSERDVALEVMRDARANWMCPTEDESFMASVAALIAIYPERRDVLMQEARALGDRNKMMQAILNGIPVDMGAWEPEDFAEGGFGLVGLWNDSLEKVS